MMRDNANNNNKKTMDSKYSIKAMNFTCHDLYKTHP